MHSLGMGGSELLCVAASFTRLLETLKESNFKFSLGNRPVEAAQISEGPQRWRFINPSLGLLACHSHPLFPEGGKLRAIKASGVRFMGRVIKTKDTVLCQAVTQGGI